MPSRKRPQTPDLVQILKDQIFPNLNLENLLQSLNPTGGGTYYTVDCPSCGEHEAFAYVGGDRIVCNRKNNCGKSMTVVEFAAGKPRPTGKDFITAVEKLAASAGVAIPKTKLSEEAADLIRKDQRRQELLASVYEQDALRLFSGVGADARAYLASRGFTDDAIRKFQLGLHDSEALRSHLIQSKQAEFYEEIIWEVINPKMNGFITIPWRNECGQPLTIYARYPRKNPPFMKDQPAWEEARIEKAIAFKQKREAGDTTEWEEPTTPKTWALPGQGTKSSPYLLDHARKAGHRDFVLVEGPLDAIMAHQHGDDRVIACIGAQLSGEQAKTLARIRAKSVTICLDPDKAGIAGNESCIKSLDQHGITAFVAPILPDGLDPDEFISRHGIEAWKKLISDAEHAYAYKAKQIITKHQQGGTLTDQAKMALIEEAGQFAEHPIRATRTQELEEFFWKTLTVSSGVAREAFRQASRPSQVVYHGRTYIPAEDRMLQFQGVDERTGEPRYSVAFNLRLPITSQTHVIGIGGAVKATLLDLVVFGKS